MQPHKNNNGFTDRLSACVERVGGKRAMATHALISEAQLFRYLNGESDVPSDRLVAIAKAADVDAGWLLTGGGNLNGPNKDKRPAFRGELMVQIVQVLEELLIEFEKPFNPRQRARAITFLYNAMRHEETVRKTEYQPNKFDLLKSLSFIAELRSEEELDVLNRVLTLLEYSTDGKDYTHEQLELLRTWNNLLVRGTKGYYSSYPGQVYFERKSGGPLEASGVMELQNLIMQACKLGDKTELDWLDLGCGSGRHLAHLAKHAPNIHLRGIELSQLGYTMCKDLMQAEKLPQGCVTMGDMRQLPLGSESIDVVYANMSLYCLPYLPGTGLGLEEAMQEIVRVLRPNGLARLTFPRGNWRDYSMSFQFMDVADIEALIKPYPLEITDLLLRSREAPATVVTGNSAIPHEMRLNHQSYIHVTLHKK